MPSSRELDLRQLDAQFAEAEQVRAERPDLDLQQALDVAHERREAREAERAGAVDAALEKFAAEADEFADLLKQTAERLPKPQRETYWRLPVDLAIPYAHGCIERQRQSCARPRQRRAAPARTHGSRRAGASSSTSSSDPGDGDPDPEPPPPRPRLTLAPPPRAIYTYGILTAAERGAEVEAVAS